MDADRLARLKVGVFPRDSREFGITHPFAVRINEFDTGIAPMRFSNYSCAARVVMGVGKDAFVVDELNNQISDYYKCTKHVATLKWTHPDVM